MRELKLILLFGWNITYQYKFHKSMNNLLSDFLNYFIK